MIDERLQEYIRYIVSRGDGYPRQHEETESYAALLESRGFTCEIDDAGNVRASRGTPTWLFCAHMDNIEGCPGYDDKCGIGIIAHLAGATDLPVRVLWTAEEEVGQLGARAIEKEWFDGLRGALVLDRRGDSDLVTRIGKVALCSMEMGRTLVDLWGQHGLQYDPCDGRMSDAYILARHLPTINLSVGFHEEHTKREWCDFEATTKAYHAAKLLLESAVTWE